MSPTSTAGHDDPSARHRLPYAVEPRRYALRLAPDLEAATFAGEVRIEARVHEPVTEIVLNAAELAVRGARLERDGRPDLALHPQLDEEAERVVLGATKRSTRGRS